MYVVFTQLHVRPERRDEFLAVAMDYAVTCLRDEGGTLDFMFIQDEDNPDRFYAHEAYEDRAAYEAHLAGAAYRHAAPQFAALLTGPPLRLAAGTAMVAPLRG